MHSPAIRTAGLKVFDISADNWIAPSVSPGTGQNAWCTRWVMSVSKELRPPPGAPSHPLYSLPIATPIIRLMSRRPIPLSRGPELTVQFLTLDNMKLNRHVDIWATRSNDYVDAHREPFQFRYFAPMHGRGALINNQGEDGAWQIRHIQNGITISRWLGGYPTLEAAEQELEAEYEVFAS
jgi:hypothetical protein